MELLGRATNYILGLTEDEFNILHHALLADSESRPGYAALKSLTNKFTHINKSRTIHLPVVQASLGELH